MKNKVLITRQKQKAVSLINELNKRGIDAFAVPVTETVYDLPQLPDDLNSYDWVAFTSSSGVRAFNESLKKYDKHLPENIRMAAVGASTAEQIGRLFKIPEIVSPVADTKSLAENIKNKIDPNNSRILWPCAAEAFPEFEEILAGSGFEVTRWECYRTIAIEPAILEVELKAVFPWDLVFFAAPSAVKAFTDAWRSDYTFISMAIGETTAAALRAERYENVAISDGVSVTECANSISRALKSKSAEPK